MKRFGFYVGIIGIFLALVISSGANTTFAGEGCCGLKSVSAGEKQGHKCIVCGNDIDSKGNPVKIEHEDKVIYVCSEKCAEVFKKDPGACKRGKNKGH